MYCFFSFLCPESPFSILRLVYKKMCLIFERLKNGISVKPNGCLPYGLVLKPNDDKNGQTVHRSVSVQFCFAVDDNLQHILICAHLLIFAHLFSSFILAEKKQAVDLFIILMT